MEMPGIGAWQMGGGGRKAAPKAQARSAAKGGTLQDAELLPGAGKVPSAPNKTVTSAKFAAIVGYLACSAYLRRPNSAEMTEFGPDKPGCPL